MGSHDKCCSVCIESSAILSWIQAALNGEELSDFSLSFPAVQQIIDLRRECQIDRDYMAECRTLEKELSEIAEAMNAYPDSDLVLLAKTLTTRDKHCTELEKELRDIKERDIHKSWHLADKEKLIDCLKFTSCVKDAIESRYLELIKENKELRLEIEVLKQRKDE